MLSTYPACFFKEENGYSVIFPDFNIATCGNTLDESIEMAIDLLAGHIYSSEMDGEILQAPSSLSEINIDSVASELYDNQTDYSESFTNLVSVNVNEYAKLHFNKSVKKTLTIPDWMNRQAIAMGLNFSQVLQEALLQKIGMK